MIALEHEDEDSNPTTLDSRKTTNQRLQQILRWCFIKKSLNGLNACQLCLTDSTIKPEDVKNLSGEKQHKVHIVESLMCQSWSINKTKHAGKHSNVQQFIRTIKPIEDSNLHYKCPHKLCEDSSKVWKGPNKQRNFHLHVVNKHSTSVTNLTKDEGYLFAKDYFTKYFDVSFNRQEFDSILQEKNQKKSKR